MVNAFRSRIDDHVGFVFGKPCSNRTDWDVRKLRYANSWYKQNGESYLGTPQPAWSDADYLDYYTSNSRGKGETMMNNRVDRLYPLALAACYNWDRISDYVVQLNEELISIANQKTWVWAAHGILL